MDQLFQISRYEKQIKRNNNWEFQNGGSPPNEALQNSNCLTF